MANTMKALQTVSVGSGGAASISFTNIPQNYTDLIIKVSGRTAFAGIYDIMNFTINGLTTVISTMQIYGTGTTANSDNTTTATNVAWLGYPQANTATANIFGNLEIYLPNYVGSTYKSISYDAVDENNATASMMYLGAGLWSETKSITSLTLSSANGSNWLQYSTATLYGVFNSDVSSAPSTPTIGTATAGNASASITFTGVSGAASYTATSTPGSFTGSSNTSPVTVSGLTNGTSYTFTVQANNPFGSSGQSAASNSVTPVAPVIPLLGAWTTAGTTSPGAGGDAYYGVSLVSSEPRVFAFAGGRSTSSYYNNGAGGTWTASSAARPVGQGLGSSSKSMTNSGLFYTYGGDTGDQTLVYSTSTGGSWTSQSAVSYSAGWSNGCYFTQLGNNYLIASGDYSSGTPAARATVATGGTLSWSNITSYPVYASAPSFERLTSVAVGMGGFTSPSLSARRTDVYSYSASANSWTSQTSLPFTPSGGYFPTAGLVGPADSRIYISDGGTSLWSRGDSSGTWRSETATPNTWAVGWGTVTSSGSYRLQLTNTGNTFYQTVL